MKRVNWGLWAGIAASALLVAACANNKNTLDALLGASGGSGVEPGTAAATILASIAGANSPSAIAAAVAAGAEMESSGVNLGLQQQPPPTLLARLRELIYPIPSVFASNACGGYSASSSTCAGSGDQVVEVIYVGCSFGTSTAVWNGGQILTFGGSAACGSTILPIENVGDQLTRTFTGKIGNSPTTRTSSTGLVVSLDTNNVSGYSISVSGGTFIAGATASGGTPVHTLEVLGLHAVSSLWDYSISNAVNLTVINPGPTATIESGTLTVQHNTALFTGTSVFTNVAFGGTSCIPVSGHIVTTYSSGSIAGQETLTFTGGGTATYLNSFGVTSNVTLTNCF